MKTQIKEFLILTLTLALLFVATLGSLMVFLIIGPVGGLIAFMIIAPLSAILIGELTTKLYRKHVFCPKKGL